MKQNLAPAKQELQHLKNGSSLNEFEVALLDNKISQCEESDLKAVLKAAMLKVGVRATNLPNDEEKGIIIAFIRQNYGNHTTAEIRIAFDMAIAGKLDIDLNEVNCYENFTCLYFSKIMTAYRYWAKEQIKYLPKKDEVKQLPVANQSASESVKFWFNEWSESKTKNYFLFSQFTKVYDVLVANNKMNLSNEEKNNIKLKVKNDLVDSCKNDFERAKMKIAINDDSYIYPHCKKLAVALHFNKLIDIDNF